MGVAYNTLKLKIFAPLVVGRKGEYYQLLYDLLGKGYSAVKVDGQLKKLREQIILTKNKKHNIDVLVDEFFLTELKDKKSGASERLSESVERALTESKGLIKIETYGVEKLISAKFMCPYDGFSYPEIEPRLFSFTSPYGACPECNGLGTRHFFGDEVCPKCKGARLRDEALHVLIGGKNIVDLAALSIEKAFEFLDNTKLTDREKNISKVVVREIESRLRFMLNVGIEYLSLNRRAH